ncbi:MAG: folylpolyglutamate synthase/dihydrofolate synthase family protein [bacterium]|nr:folylpolyglutamate synthase/dihydrofolate synthase family protein [bacterium]
MDYKRGLAYLDKLVPWKGQGVCTLEKIEAVLARLGKPQEAYRTVHITGTNGKGSVSTAIASIMGAAGLHIGLTTSPHLVKQNERIVVDGVVIEDRFLGECADRVGVAAGREHVELTYFEGITATAFLAFKEAKVDWGIIEVGLGGRLDATNILTRPEACVITTVDYDHMHILGDTLEEISREKAGIIKYGSKVIVGELSLESLLEVRLAAKRAGARELRCGGDDFWAKIEGQGAFKFTSIHDGKETVLKITPSLVGAHQAQNMAVAMETCRVLGFSTYDLENGIKSTYWPGRLETIEVNGVKILLDCAHNIAGLKALTEYLKSQNLRDIVVLFGVLTRPDWKEMVSALNEFVGSWYLMDPPTDRAVKSSEVQQHLSSIGVNSKIVNSHKEFWNDVGVLPKENNVLITGSLYLLGSVLSYLQETKSAVPQKQLWKRKS